MGSEVTSVGAAPARPFRLHIGGFALAVALLGAMLTWTPPDAHAPRSGSVEAYWIGRWVGIVIVAAVLAWIGYRVRGRSPLTGNVVFATVLGLQLMYGLAEWRKAELQKQAAAVQGVEKVIAQARSKGLQHITADDRQQMVHALDTAAASADGDAKAFMRAVSRTMSGLTVLANACQKADAEVTRIGGLFPVGVQSREQLEMRLSAIRTLRETRQSLATEWEQLGERLSGAFKAEGLDPRRIPVTTAAVLKSAHHKESLHGHALWLKACDASIAMHTQLLDTWGQWRPGESGGPIFQSQGALDAYEAQRQALMSAMLDVRGLTDRMERVVAQEDGRN